MMGKVKIRFTLLCMICTAVQAQPYDSYKGLVMAGYQGWFNTPYDDAGRGWKHYGGQQGFYPGSCSIDFWPDISDYSVIYKTPFRFSNGRSAYTFSSHDSSTVDTHFRWMKEYGIDGVFMQRFVTEIKNPQGKAHFDKVLSSAIASAHQYRRAISVMYDLSGISPGDENLVLDDIDRLEKEYNFKTRKKLPTYLYHNEKPLIAVWGVGFNDRRKYGLDEADHIIEGLCKRGYSIMIGVPTYWRELIDDTQNDNRLHAIIRKCDIVLPWFVGRYNEQSYETFKSLIQKDMDWCKQNGIDYAPLCYPGFSWKNMRGANSFYVDRNSGSFFWKQCVSAVEYGAEMIYIAMFDEIDEGTAIFKCARRGEVPDNKTIRFDGIEDHLTTDFYLWLTGEAGKMLRKERLISRTVPYRSDYADQKRMYSK